MNNRAGDRMTSGIGNRSKNVAENESKKEMKSELETE
jgi:hypothetical protein